MENRKFAMHGQFELQLEDRILILSGEGPANSETIQEYSEKVAPIVDELQSAPWVHIFHVSGLAITTPEARELMRLSALKGKSRGLAATAIIFRDVEFVHSATQFWSGIYQDIDLQHGFFENRKEAKKWARHIIDTTDQTVSTR